MKKKYVVFPGNTIGKRDGHTHFINAGRLMALYRVNPAECVIVNYPYTRAEGYDKNSLIPLYPSFHGDYTLPGT